MLENLSRNAYNSLERKLTLKKTVMSNQNEIEQCEQCHVEMPPQIRRRGLPRRFCSARCRLAAYVARGGTASKTERSQRKELRSDDSETLDLLYGADEIAVFLYGDPEKRNRVYAMDHGELGLFRLGKAVCGRRSTIRERIAAREDQ